MVGREDLLICKTCGTQFDVPADKPLKACRICDDPRQFVPPTGQAWTSLSSMKDKHKNVWYPDEVDTRMTSIVTEPQVGIGQRCILLETPNGNVLWDCIAYIDAETVDKIKARGGLKAIVISHPHYYTTHLDWAEAFDCAVYISAEDEEWVNRKDSSGRRKLIQKDFEEIVPGVIAAKTGGHFPGSLVLNWEKMLLIADTLVTCPSAYYHIDRPPGTTSYVFMYSIPNHLPLPPSDIMKMWRVLKKLDFESTHAAFVRTEIRDKNVKARVLESMKIQVRCMGHDKHEIFDEKWPEA